MNTRDPKLPETNSDVLVLLLVAGHTFRVTSSEKDLHASHVFECLGADCAVKLPLYGDLPEGLDTSVCCINNPWERGPSGPSTAGKLQGYDIH